MLREEHKVRVQVVGDLYRVERLEKRLDHVAEGPDEDVELVDGLGAQRVLLIVGGGCLRRLQVSR